MADTGYKQIKVYNDPGTTYFDRQQETAQGCNHIKTYKLNIPTGQISINLNIEIIIKITGYNIK